MMVKVINIGGRKVGGDNPCFIIAEISCNHLQKKEYALKLVGEAKAAGADAVKFQTYTPDTITLDVDNEYFRIKGTLWNERTLYDLYKEAYTPWEWFPGLKDQAKQEGLVFFSSPFDESAVDFLENLNVPAYKIASFEINHIPLITHAAKLGKPMFMSTGVATLEDIELAVKTVRDQKNDKIILLKCTSAYPAPYNEMNLSTIPDLAKRFDVIAGLSDHSLGIVAPVAAVALGAKVIEKHIMLNRKLGGPDVEFSLEPAEFKEMVQAVRAAEQSVGKVGYELGSKTKEMFFARRSIFASVDIAKGDLFTSANIKVVRPGYGLAPRYYDTLIGKRSKRVIRKGEPIVEGMS